jgi:hypothetical protein
MKRMKIAGLMFVCLIIVTKFFAQSGSTEQMIVPLSNPGKPYTLKVNLIEGSIKVSSHEGQDIIINVTSWNDQEKRSVNRESGLRLISTSGSYEVTAKELDNTVTVYSGNPVKPVDLDLKIPQDVKLNLRTVNHGNIEVTNVRGELEVNNVNKDIALFNISGSVVANTVNGDVTVTFISVDPDAPMAFSTLNGDISVTLPSATKANLKLKSDNGDVFSDFDIDIDKSQPRINKTSEAGMYKIQKDDWIYGKINGGGPEILMKNMMGEIYVKKAKQ